MDREFMTQFTFDNKKCVCEIESVVDEKRGELVEQLAIKVLPNDILPMSYIYGEGLKISNQRKASKNNILGEFLGIKKNDLYGYKSFFEKYGFLFDLEDENFCRVSIDDLDSLRENLLAFIYLLNNQKNEKNLNVKELLDGTLYLIFKKEKEIRVENISLFNIKRNYLMDIIDKTTYHGEDKENIKYKHVDGQTIGFFEIKDSLSEHSCFEMSVEDYYYLKTVDIPHWIKNLCRVLKNKEQLVSKKSWHICVDFLFHFTKELTTFYESDIYINGIFTDDIYESVAKNSKLLDALLKISKILLKDEFSSNLADVNPTFNVIDMQPDWKLPSLYTALYFSLFYLNGKEYGLRKCQNSTCNEYFQVSKSNSVKKYCSPYCQNATAQRRYRRRNK